ncbi:MAG TPA: DUF2505 family protein [Acidimicrobiales bacterium]|nr:DUF2505 family protein [Acidimicrobiales bacterium]
MRFRIEQHLPGDVDDVIDALLDEDFVGSLGALPKIGKPELLSQHTDVDFVTQRVRYRFTGELSGAVTAVLDPAKLTWVAETTYDRRARHATFRIVPDHYGNRLQCAGRHAFTRGDGETMRVIEGELKVSYPLVGRTIEKAVLSGLEEHLAAECEVLTTHLTAG